MGQYLVKTKPSAKIAVLFQNDDYGKDYVKGFKAGLGAKAGQIVKETSYELTDSTVNNQVSNLKDSGADTFADFSIDKFTTQAIKQSAALDWHPLHLLGSSGTAVVPASGALGKGIISTAYLKVVTDPTLANDPAVAEYRRIIGKYAGAGVPADDQGVVYGVAEAMTAQHVLEQTKEPTRTALMDAAKSIHGYVCPLLLNGMTVDTSPSDYFPLQQSQVREFDGKTWDLKGGVIDAATG
jgi:ABC-type branched-subunit amino acid transport system substrate-binding protein